MLIAKYLAGNIARIVALAAVVIATAMPAFASVDDDLQLWTPVTLDVPIYKKVRGYCEVAPRIGDGVGKLNQFLLRPGIEYRFTDDFSLFAGYLWQRTYSENSINYENRIWQQALFDKDIKRLSIINRTRLEQRFFNTTGGTGNRLRHMVKLNLGLYRQLYLTTSNELFLNLNSVNNGPQRGVDQNRFFAGIGLKSYKGSRIEAGYQYQYVNRSDEFDDQGNHAILIQTFIGLRD